MARGGFRAGAGRKPDPNSKRQKALAARAARLAAKDEKQAAPTEPTTEQAPDSLAVPPTEDPKVFLAAVMNDLATAPKLRVEAAKALLPFMHKKLGEGGKKEQRQQAAGQVAGRFTPSAPPKLVAAGGKKV